MILQEKNKLKIPIVKHMEATKIFNLLLIYLVKIEIKENK